MIRNLKVLGLVLVAAFAISAIAATAASAQQGKLTTAGLSVTLKGEETAGGGSVTLTGRQTGTENLNALTAFGFKGECPGRTWVGHKYNETPHNFIPHGGTTITLTPMGNEAKCRWFGFFPTTTEMNGCDYVLHIGETTGGVMGTYALTTDLVCPAGKEITMTLFASEAKHNEKKPFCKLDIAPQFFLGGLHATDTGSGDFSITGTVEGLHIKRTMIESSGSFCTDNSTTTAAEYDLDLTLKGYNVVGEGKPISLSDF